MILKIILIIIAVVIGYLLFMIIIGARVLRKFIHFPAPFFVGYFLDSNFRRRLQPPDKLIERSGIKEGMKVLDLGCGSGAYTTFIARAVGGKGKVYAVDIQSQMLKQLQSKLNRPENRDIKNIETKIASAYNLPFKNSSFDIVSMVTVLQEIPDKHKALQEIKRVLKSNGIFVVTEFLPDPDYPLESTTIKICSAEGFVLKAALGSLWNYTVRFKKQ